MPTDFNPSTLTPILVLMLALLMGEEMSPERLSNFSKLTQQDDHRKLPGFRISALDLLQMLLSQGAARVIPVIPGTLMAHVGERWL